MQDLDIDPVLAWKKLAIPAVFAILAAGCYWKTLASHLQPEEFVQVKRNISPFEEISLNDLEPISIYGQSEAFKKGALLWSDVTMAYGAKATRELPMGRFLQLSDIDTGDKLQCMPGEQSRTLNLPNNGTTYVHQAVEVGMMVKAAVLTKSKDNSLAQAYIGPFRVLEIVRDTSDQGRDSPIRALVLGTRDVDKDTPDPAYTRLLAATEVAQRGASPSDSRGECLKDIVPDLDVLPDGDSQL